MAGFLFKPGGNELHGRGEVGCDSHRNFVSTNTKRSRYQGGPQQGNQTGRFHNKLLQIGKQIEQDQNPSIDGRQEHAGRIDDDEIGL
jgi:hypothetical protein